MKQKDILIIIILLFIFAVAWIGSSIYHSAVSSTISETTSKDISPIKPDFDIQAIQKLKTRKEITPSFELGTITPTPIDLPTPTVSSETASEGGLLLL